MRKEEPKKMRRSDCKFPHLKWYDHLFIAFLIALGYLLCPFVWLWERLWRK